MSQLSQPPPVGASIACHPRPSRVVGPTAAQRRAPPDERLTWEDSKLANLPPCSNRGSARARSNSSVLYRSVVIHKPAELHTKAQCNKRADSNKERTGSFRRPSSSTGAAGFQKHPLSYPAHVIPHRTAPWRPGRVAVRNH